MEKYITVCDCGAIIYNGQLIGFLFINPEYKDWHNTENEREMALTFVKDGCNSLNSKPITEMKKLLREAEHIWKGYVDKKKLRG